MVDGQTALAVIQRGSALAFLNAYGLIAVSDADRLRFLHNQTTNSFQERQPGSGCDTVFVTSTARTIDLVTAYITEEGVLLLTSPGLDQRLMEWMDRYIFFADKVTLQNLTDTTAKFALVGPQAGPLLEQLGAELPPATTGSHQLTAVAGYEVRVATGTGAALPGYTLLVSGDGSAVAEAIQAAGAASLGEADWQWLLARQGRPLPGSELTDDYNPLEAGLWHAISFEKGCYIGQETIARLNTYQGVKQQLWGLRLSAPAAPGDAISLDGAKVGTVTRAIDTPEGPAALGYIRTKAGGAGLQVNINGAAATVVDLPFLSRGYLAEVAAT